MEVLVHAVVEWMTLSRKRRRNDTARSKNNATGWIYVVEVVVLAGPMLPIIGVDSIHIIMWWIRNMGRTRRERGCTERARKWVNKGYRRLTFSILLVVMYRISSVETRVTELCCENCTPNHNGRVRSECVQLVALARRLRSLSSCAAAMPGWSVKRANYGPMWIDYPLPRQWWM